MRLRLSDYLTLPAEAATQTFLVVGKRGSGKSTTCVRLAEQLIKADVPIVAIDPVDRWWGLKASRDGKGPGLCVYVFGGEHADLPLEAGAGAVIADTLVEHRLSAVLSVKHLSGRERGQFVSDLAGRLFQRNKEPLHVFLEEAHEVAPQQPFKGEEEMLGRVTRLWKLGRSSGLGGSAITQRPASLSKNITTQAEILIVHRTLGPQDVAAVREWIRYHGERDDILGELATLKTGECFVWAPDFPEGKPIGLKRVQILDRETFDSSATPKVGQRAAEPKALAPVDIEKLRSRMAATIEKAKAEDPRELRREIAVLKAQLSQRPVGNSERPVRNIEPKRVEIPILKDAQIKRLEALVGILDAAEQRFYAVYEARSKELLGAASALAATVRAKLATPQQPIPARPILPAARSTPPGLSGYLVTTTRPATGKVTIPTEGITPAKQRILDALAFLEGIGLAQADKVQLALMADARPTSGAYFNNLGALRTAELIAYPRPGTVALTGRGAPTTTEELHAVIRAKLPPAKWRLLEVLIGVYPKPIAKDELATRAGARETSGAYFNNLGSLRSLGLLDYPSPGQVVACPVLFLEGR
jgi:uncharacterized protein